MSEKMTNRLCAGWLLITYGPSIPFVLFEFYKEMITRSYHLFF
jgi:hypothetical protein